MKKSKKTSYYGVERSEILDLLSPKYNSILDIGCGNGATMRLIKEKIPSAHILGIDLLELSSAENTENIINGDISNDAAREILSKKGPFDCILMLDVLEHLVDPWETLAYAKGLLTQSGIVVLSLPNIANLKVIAPLILRDEFTYSKSGILDKTHLRFFTKKSAKQLVESAGLKTTLIRTTGPTHISQIKSSIGLALYVLNRVMLKIFERFIVRQYIIGAEK